MAAARWSYALDGLAQVVWAPPPRALPAAMAPLPAAAAPASPPPGGGAAPEARGARAAPPQALRALRERGAGGAAPGEAGPSAAAPGGDRGPRRAAAGGPGAAGRGARGGARARAGAAASAARELQALGALRRSPRRSRRLLRGLLVAAAGAACWALLRGPARASAGLGSAAPVLLEGTLAERVARYTGVCGSLFSDLGVAVASFFVLACCAGTETAITTLWPWKVREFAMQERERDESGKWNALRKDIQRFMQTILIGTTLSSVISASFITEMCGQLFGPRGLGIATVSVTAIQLTAGEIIPKLLAVSNPVSFCSVTLPVFYRISMVVYPVSRFLNTAVSLMLRFFGISVDTSKTPLVSEAELDLMFNSAMKSGVLDGEEGDMIRSVRKMDRKTVKEVMTPLIDMICIDAQQPLSSLYELWRDTQYSRVPVYSNRFDSIVGVVSMKMLLKHVKLFGDADARGADLVESICDKPFFVPETMSLLSALRTLKERSIAICVDEYGGTTGLVTLEDVLEQIVGEIYDPEEEKDKIERVQNSSMIKKLGENRWGISAVADVEDVSDVLGIELPNGSFNSIGGFMCMYLEQIPEAGQAVLVETATKNVRFEVSEVDDRRVLQIEAFIEAGEEGEDRNRGKGSAEESPAEDEDERDKVLDVRMETGDGQEDASEGKGRPADKSADKSAGTDASADSGPAGGKMGR
ncbi:unnamed protein product [Prorocentrum cordatum]|uniref:Uncharacterized protein n=1 Tax=Prorocentrum cordatum TaxID=2364126 RepID=A0ABN9XTE6_9DINO|nr:unnamed protein product [Polarella glacialis]